MAQMVNLRPRHFYLSVRGKHPRLLKAPMIPDVTTSPRLVKRLEEETIRRYCLAKLKAQNLVEARNRLLLNLNLAGLRKKTTP